MKRAHVKDKFGMEHNFIVLRTLEDILEYQKMLDGETSQLVHKLITSDIPVNSWDHIRMSGEKGSLLHGSMCTAVVKGSNPLYELPGLISGKIKRFLDLLTDEETIFVNKNGGYCYYMPGYHEILSEEEYRAEPPNSAVIKANTTYINLENDPQLERHTIQYLSTKDKNFSYVLNLRDYDVHVLTKVFSDFRDNGGCVVYVYTTGIDVPQMYDYSEAIVAAGLKHVEFEFNAGENPEHKNLVQYLVERGVEVKVID